MHLLQTSQFTGEKLKPRQGRGLAPTLHQTRGKIRLILSSLYFLPTAMHSLINTKQLFIKYLLSYRQKLKLKWSLHSFWGEEMDTNE